MQKPNPSDEGWGKRENESLNNQGIAELKEAFGRLYKRVEEAEAANKAQREKDREVLHLWAETNLVQTELLGKQTKLIDQLTQELRKNETYWQKFARSSGDLMRDLISLKQQLMSMQPQTGSAEPMLTETQATGEEAAPQPLLLHRRKSREMLELETALARIWSESEEMPNAMRLERLSRIAWSLEEIRQGRERIQKIQFDVVPVTQKSAIWIAGLAVIIVIACVMGVGLFRSQSLETKDIKSAISGVNNRLVKIEKRLGNL